MPTRTKFVILMHPYEFKRIKANTGRLTHICLPDSELFVGESFDTHEDVQALINDPKQGARSRQPKLRNSPPPPPRSKPCAPRSSRGDW